MFDVGQKVICVRKEPWVCIATGESLGPSFGAECVVTKVYPEGYLFTARNGFQAKAKYVCVEVAGWRSSVFDGIYFRPKEPNIEALHSLLTKQTEEVR